MYLFIYLILIIYLHIYLLLLGNTLFGKTIMKRLDEQDSKHESLLDALFSLTKSLNERPPLSARVRPTKTSTHKRERCDEVAEDECFEEELEDLEVAKRSTKTRKGIPNWYVNSIEDLLVSENQRSEESMERLRRDNRLFAALKKVRTLEKL